MDALALIENTEILPTEAGGCSIRLKTQVDAKDYALFKKMAEYAGGVYVNPKVGHIFKTSGAETARYMDAVAKRAVSGKINDLDFFPTPDAVCHQALDNVVLLDSYGDYLIENRPAEFRVLEPSAGTGAFIDAFLNKYPNFSGDIVAVEIDPIRCELLRIKYEAHENVRVVEGDIKDIDRDDLGVFNLVLMNPPFNDWPRHLEIARSLLDDRFGVVTSILPRLSLVLSPRGGANNAALDVLSECYANYGIIDAIKDNAFKSTRGNGRTGVTSTGIACDIATLMDVSDIPHEKLVADVSHMSVLVIENLYDSVKAIEKITQTNLSSDAKNGAMNAVDAVSEYISKNRHHLVTEGLCPVHSKYTDIKAVSASLVRSYAENMSIELPPDANKSLEEMMKPLHYEEPKIAAGRGNEPSL